MKTSKILSNKISKPKGQLAATLLVVSVGLVAPNLSESGCAYGDLGDCETMVDGSDGCTAGGWWDDCGNGGSSSDNDLIIEIPV